MLLNNYIHLNSKLSFVLSGMKLLVSEVVKHHRRAQGLVNISEDKAMISIVLF